MSKVWWTARRVILLPGDLDIRIALVILEADIVLRAVFLDQVALQDEGLNLGVGDDEVEIGDVVYQAVQLGGVAGRSLEVGAHPMPQVNRLAHVDHLAPFVLHQVDAGLGGKGLQFVFQ